MSTKIFTFRVFYPRSLVLYRTKVFRRVVWPPLHVRLPINRIFPARPPPWWIDATRQGMDWRWPIEIRQPDIEIIAIRWPLLQVFRPRPAPGRDAFGDPGSFGANATNSQLQ